MAELVRPRSRHDDEDDELDDFDPRQGGLGERSAGVSRPAQDDRPTLSAQAFTPMPISSYPQLGALPVPIEDPQPVAALPQHYGSPQPRIAQAEGQFSSSLYEFDPVGVNVGVKSAEQEKQESDARALDSVLSKLQALESKFGGMDARLKQVELMLNRLPERPQQVPSAPQQYPMGRTQEVNPVQHHTVVRFDERLVQDGVALGFAREEVLLTLKAMYERGLQCNDLNLLGEQLRKGRTKR